MGVDTKAFISNEWEINMVERAIRNSPLVTQCKRKTSEIDLGNCMDLRVQLLNPRTDEITTHRIFVIKNFSRGGFRGTALSAVCYGSAPALLKEITKKLGGLYCHNDSDDQWEIFENPVKQNLGFLLKKAVAEGHCDGRNHEQFIKYLQEYKQEK